MSHTTGENSDLDMAGQATQNGPPDDSEWRNAYESYERTGDTKYLNKAIEVTRNAINATPQDRPERLALLSNLSEFLRLRSYVTGMEGDLNTAILVAREAVDATPHDDPDRAGRLTNLANALWEGYTRTSNKQNLEDAIDLSREAAKVAPESDPDRYLILNSLAIQVGDRYLEGQSEADLDEAISVGCQALNAAPQDDAHASHRATMLVNLGVRLDDRFTRKGEMADIDNAIRKTREALALIPSRSSTNYSRAANELASRLSKRYSRIQQMSDLDEAIRISLDALDSAPSRHSYRPYVLHNLAHRFSARYTRTREIADLNEAIRLAQEAVNLTEPNDAQWARRQSSLGVQLYERYLEGGRKEAKDLENAIRVMRETVEGTPEAHWHYAGWANNLSKVLADSGPTHLDESIRWAEKAVSTTPEADSDRAGWLNHLGARLCERHSRINDMTDLMRAKESFTDALYHDACPTRDGMEAGRQLLSNPNFLPNDQLEEAYQAAQRTIRLVSLLAPRSLENTDKQHLLTEAVGLASQAAAVVLLADKEPAAALELLEAGRGLLMGSLYDMRSDNFTLREKHPELAESFVKLRDQLDAPSLGGSALVTVEDAGVRPDAGRRLEVGKQMEELIEKIRSQPGFERFLLPASQPEVLEASTDGPIVVLNVSVHRCDALIIRPSGIQVLELPEVSHQEIGQRREQIASDVVATLGWLWDKIVGPVLDFLGFTQHPADDCWPRVWWIPTGSLVRFPLHAAGHHLEGGSRTALDRVVSSYSTSIRAIIHGRRQGRKRLGPTVGGKLVLVAMEQTPGYQSLSHAAKETDVVGKQMKLPCLFPSHNKEEVLSALQDCRIFHFAGHGEVDATQPLQSRLLLEDCKRSPLTVASLLDTNLGERSPFLAYLSACGSGQVRDDKSVDESIHLSSAFQLAGFRHVIGTLWEVNDALCVTMAELTYQFLQDNGITDRSVGEALQHATRTLRDKWATQWQSALGGGGTPGSSREGRLLSSVKKTSRMTIKEVLWVPYVHYGV